MTSTETNSTVAQARKQLTIKVFGVGGCGGNVVSHIHRMGFGGVQMIVLNTDSQALAQCPLPYKFNLGLTLNGGLGAGGDPERGRAAAQEDEARLRELCTGADMVFICAGLGGGNGGLGCDSRNNNDGRVARSKPIGGGDDHSHGARNETCRLRL